MSEDIAEKAARRSPVQGRSQETVQRVLAATSALLARGVAPEVLTTAQIAGEAGLSVGAIYRFFQDKQAIVDAIAVARMEEFEQALGLRFMFAMPDSPTALLGAVIDAFAEYLAAHPEFRTLAYGGPGGGRYISRQTREAQAGAGQIADMVRAFLAEAFDWAPDAGFDFRLRCAIEIGDRMIGFAFEQPDETARRAVLAEAKALLGGYLFAL
jgi:AcrR family transcriptional regulator